MTALAASAAVQAGPCDDFKAVLAARIESTGVRGYSLEVVPADVQVPSDAKVIATCESGTRKFLYRRWGAARAATTGAANAARAASAAQLPTTADAPARRAPITREERAPKAPPAATPAVVLPPAPRASEAASAPAATAAAPITPTARSEVTAAPANERTVVVPPAPVKAETAAVVPATLTQRVSGFLVAQWQWLGALALVVLLGGFWMWRVPFGAYDKDGLPRGPKL